MVIEYTDNSSGQNKGGRQINFNLPIEIGQKFRRLIIDNYRLISQKFDYLDSYLKKHRTEEKKAHKSSQIDHDGNSLDREIKQMQGEFDNVIITNNGDGIAEVTQAQVDMVGTRHEVLAKRLRADFLNLEGQVDETNKELEKSKVIRSAYDFDVYPDQDIDSSKGLQNWLDWNNHRGGGTIILRSSGSRAPVKVAIRPEGSIKLYPVTSDKEWTSDDYVYQEVSFLNN